MTLDYQEVFRLLVEAENKVQRFEEKIKNISAALKPLQVKREAALAVLEYASREESRRQLTDLFVKYGEYGSPLNFSAELLSKVEQRKNELDQRIHSYELRLEERQRGIEFIRHDIELLKRVQHLEVEASFHEKAGLIDE